MLNFVKGDLLQSDCDILVNACNKVGVMGGGIAKKFADKFPQFYKEYKNLCKIPESVGKNFDVFRLSNHFFVAFYTKNHWKDDSNLDQIDAGLAEIKLDLERAAEQYGYSIAFPALGCGLGGLAWTDVKPLFEKHFGTSNYRVDVYEPWE